VRYVCLPLCEGWRKEKGWGTRVKQHDCAADIYIDVCVCVCEVGTARAPRSRVALRRKALTVLHTRAAVLPSTDHPFPCSPRSPYFLLNFTFLLTAVSTT
jgi:hypothetical protein